MSEEPQQPDGLTRRKFVGTMLGAGILAASGEAHTRAITHVANIGGREKGEGLHEEIHMDIPEPLVLNNLTVQFIGAIHSKEFCTPEDLVTIRTHVKDADVLIPEYFPVEYLDDFDAQDIIGKLGREKYAKDDYWLFEQLEQIAIDESKDVVVLDPAHGKEYMVEFIGGSIAAASLSLSAFALPSMYAVAAMEDDVTRRSLLRSIRDIAWLMASKILLQKLAAKQLDPEDESRRRQPSEALSDTLRAACVAAHIHEMSQTIHGTAVIVYPSTHVARIRRFLDDDQPREELVDLAKKLYDPLPHGDAFLSRRHYHHNGDWQKTQSTKLSALSKDGS